MLFALCMVVCFKMKGCLVVLCVAILILGTHSKVIGSLGKVFVDPEQIHLSLAGELMKTAVKTFPQQRLNL